MVTGGVGKLVSNGDYVRAGELIIIGKKMSTVDVDAHWRSCDP